MARSCSSQRQRRARAPRAWAFQKRFGVEAVHAPAPWRRRAKGGGMMTEIFAQGDLLIERVPDVVPSGAVEENAQGTAMVLLEGEATGHAHAIRERVMMFRD